MKELSFKEWLEGRGALRPFLCNYLTRSADPEWKVEVEPWCPVDWINAAFRWTNTREGHDFWDKLDDAWRDECGSGSGDRSVVLDMPLFDPMGMVLLRADMESGDGED